MAVMGGVIVQYARNGEYPEFDGCQMEGISYLIGIPGLFSNKIYSSVF